MHRILFLSVLMACGDHATSADLAQAAEPSPVAAADPGDPADDTVLAKWKGGQITYAELRKDIDGQLTSKRVQYMVDRYELQSRTLEQKIDEALLSAEAAKQGVADTDALLAVEIESKTAEPEAEEIAAFYEAVKSQLSGQTLDQAYPRLKLELHRRAMGEKYQEYIATLRKKAKLKTQFAYPDLPRFEVAIADHDPVLGDADAEVTIVQFAEYQCPFCGKVKPALERLLKEYPDKVQLVFKDFPLGFHDNAMSAAVSAHCADEQGKYWEMNGRLLDNQDRLGAADLERYATEIGLDLGPWRSCIGSGKYEPTIQEDMALGQQIGVQATPTFFINGIQLSGAQPYERFADVVEREIAP